MGSLAAFWKLQYSGCVLCVFAEWLYQTFKEYWPFNCWPGETLWLERGWHHSDQAITKKRKCRVSVQSLSCELLPLLLINSVPSVSRWLSWRHVAFRPTRRVESVPLRVLILLPFHLYRLGVQVETERERQRLPSSILPGIWSYISPRTCLDMLATSGKPQ